MDALINNPGITIPMSQIIFLIVLSSFLVIFSKFKSALLTNFVFLIYCIFKNTATTCTTWENFSTSYIIPLTSSYTLISGMVFIVAVIMIYYELFDS